MAKSLKPKKAPVPDKIRNEMLKTGIKLLNVALFKLFNLILQSGSFPILVQLLTVIKTYIQSAEGVSHITTERFNAIFASVRWRHIKCGNTC